MPVYEFECPQGHITEKLTRMGTNRVQCSQCTRRAKKIMSTCTFELKGGGWYADGYSTTRSASNTKTSGTVSSGTKK